MTESPASPPPAAVEYFYGMECGHLPASEFNRVKPEDTEGGSCD